MLQSKSEWTENVLSKNSKFEVTSELGSNKDQKRGCRRIFSKSLLTFTLIFICVLFFVFGLFYTFPRLLKDLIGLYNSQDGELLRSDTRISDIIEHKRVSPFFLRKIDPVFKNYRDLDFYKSYKNNNISIYSTDSRMLKVIEEPEYNITDISLISDNNYDDENYSPLSGKLSNFEESMKNSTEDGLNNYICNLFVTSEHQIKSGEYQLGMESKLGSCILRTVFVQIPESIRAKKDKATLNAINSINGTLLAVKGIIESLNNKPSDQGALVLLSSNMEYSEDWVSVVKNLYSDWEGQTHVSQMLFSPWSTSKSFFTGKHAVPALDYNFMILNIPPEVNKHKNYSAEFSDNLAESLTTVITFLNDFRDILEDSLDKIKNELNMDFIVENNFTDDLLLYNNNTLESYNSLNKYFNENNKLLTDNFMASIALELSKLVENTPLTIVDSSSLSRDKLERFYKKDISSIYSTDVNSTQVVIISSGERKKIATYNYEEKFRRVCLYQAHTEMRSILRSTVTRASLVEYARFHGYSYSLFDGSFYDRIPRILFTDWSKQGYYIKLFSGLRLLFWDLDKVGEFIGKHINNYKQSFVDEDVYNEFLEKVVPNNVNVNWDREHDGKFGFTGEIKKGGISGLEGIQMTPANNRVDICDFIVWFDMDTAITNKYFSVEKLLYDHYPSIGEGYNDKYKGIEKDTSNIAFFAARDSEWKSRLSLVNSGFMIFSRSRYSLQTIFHAIALSPTQSQEVVKNGRFWPEQSTLSHAVFKLYNHSLSSPKETFSFNGEFNETVRALFSDISACSPFLFSTLNNETNIYTHSLIVSQKTANGFLHIKPDQFGQGPWYPGDWFIHAAGHSSPFRDNVLTGLIFSINTIGFSREEIREYKRTCYPSLDFVYGGLDWLIAFLSHEFDEFESGKDGVFGEILSSYNNVDVAFNFVKRFMAVKTRSTIGESFEYYNQTTYDKIHFLRCYYELPMDVRWTVTEASALSTACIIGFVAFVSLSLFYKYYPRKGQH
ncbi:hypothetical protein FG386_003440 [Cryptosporidium ryanae]|uniref:uncharacterized protein n=1 Tax=Cryptosporidium ryanae TaxID=515981 RepID=UPI00351A6994|nr:hypothetical protein FG386_003440 [Cryptosporidium ryanae]